MDTWLLLRNVEHNGERNRTLYVLKSRGMAHSNQIREFVMTRHGVDLVEAYVGPDAVLTGSARVVKETLDRSAEAARRLAHRRKLSQVARRRKAIEAQIASLQAEAAAEAEEVNALRAQEDVTTETMRRSAAAMSKLRNGGRRS